MVNNLNNSNNQNNLNNMNQNSNQTKNNSQKKQNDSQDTLIKSVFESSKRLRILEDRYSTIRKKTQLTDQNMLESNKRFNEEIKAINEEMGKIRVSINEITEKMDQLISEVGDAANRQDLITLNKYVDLWRNMNFVTKEQLDREFDNLRSDK